MMEPLGVTQGTACSTQAGTAPLSALAGDAKPEVIVKVEPEEVVCAVCPQGLGDK